MEISAEQTVHSTKASIFEGQLAIANRELVHFDALVEVATLASLESSLPDSGLRVKTTDSYNFKQTRPLPDNFQIIDQDVTEETGVATTPLEPNVLVAVGASCCNLNLIFDAEGRAATLHKPYTSIDTDFNPYFTMAAKTVTGPSIMVVSGVNSGSMFGEGKVVTEWRRVIVDVMARNSVRSVEFPDQKIVPIFANAEARDPQKPDWIVGLIFVPRTIDRRFKKNRVFLIPRQISHEAVQKLIEMCR